jgi:NAD(P)-dependent dehydrogenase (short-subunit alcohol dehydrogenase family)
MDRRVLICGAGGGLGPVVARRLAAEGAALVAADLRREPLDALAADLGLAGERWRADALDMLDERAVQAWAAEVGTVDAVLHLVGGWRGGPGIADSDLADYAWLHDGLVRTLQHVSRAFLPALKASGRGRLVIVSSPMAERPSAGNAAYGAAKAASEAWTLAVADELAAHGGTANVVRVNAILTPRMRAEQPDGDFASFTPAEAIADAFVFLLGDGAAKMNGRRLELRP